MAPASSDNNNPQNPDPSSSATAADPTTQQEPQQPKQPLALPAAPSTEAARKLDLSAEGGGQISLDHLGPMVVNQDGTLSRISNWDKMTEIERKNTLRVLGKRNKERMDALKAAEGKGDGAA